MKYELAKQLKDAGFLMPSHTDCDRESGGCCRCGDDDKDLCIPTLSELVLACPNTKKGNPYDMDFTLRINGKEWAAGYTELIPYEGDYFDCKGNGSTPEEAVARLWLELNK